MRAIDPISSRCDNYVPIGLVIRYVLSSDFLPDPILAIVLEYYGAQMVYVVTVFERQERSNTDCVILWHKVVGAFDSRPKAILATLYDAIEQPLLDELFLADESDPASVTRFDAYGIDRLLEPVCLTEKRRNQLFKRILRAEKNISYTIEETFLA
jgi:hypothetical protein